VNEFDNSITNNDLYVRRHKSVNRQQSLRHKKGPESRITVSTNGKKSKFEQYLEA